MIAVLLAGCTPLPGTSSGSLIPTASTVSTAAPTSEGAIGDLQEFTESSASGELKAGFAIKLLSVTKIESSDPGFFAVRILLEYSVQAGTKTSYPQLDFTAFNDSGTPLEAALTLGGQFITADTFTLNVGNRKSTQLIYLVSVGTKEVILNYQPGALAGNLPIGTWMFSIDELPQESLAP